MLLWLVFVAVAEASCIAEVQRDRNCNGLDASVESATSPADPMCSEGEPWPSLDDYFDYASYGCEIPVADLDLDDDGFGGGLLTHPPDALYPDVVAVLSCDNGPTLANPDQLDADCDDVGDVCDNCPFAPNNAQDDTDADGFGDACDLCPLVFGMDAVDADGDGVGDACDVCPEAPDPAQADADQDGVGDVCDVCLFDRDPDQLDADGDGRGDLCDSCPLHADDAADADADGIGDACDVCPDTFDHAQLDSDSDGVGDACDTCRWIADPAQPDADGDLLGDGCDLCPITPDPDQADGDTDGVGDLCDVCPEDADPDQRDSDGDLMGDACDPCPATFQTTVGDADADGLDDACDQLALRGGGLVGRCDVGGSDGAGPLALLGLVALSRRWRRAASGLLLVGCSQEQGLGTVGGVEAIPAPVVVVDPVAVDFGVAPLDQTATTSVTVRNDGDAVLTVDSVTADGLSFTVLGEVPPPLDPGAAATVDVAWTPTSPDGDVGALVVTSDDPVRPVVEVPLTGVLGVPSLAIEPAAIDFGEVVCDGAEAFELVSTGTWPVTVTSSAVVGEGFVLDDIGLPMVLEPGERALLPVRLAAVDAVCQAAVVAVDSDAIGGPIEATVAGIAEVSAVGDHDADGIEDCYDLTCELEVAAAGAVTQLLVCNPGGAVVDPWTATVEWVFDSGGDGVVVMPAIGNLTDDDGDGDVDEDDTPDIAFTVWGSNKLVALNGDGSGTIFTKAGFDGDAGVAIADVDADGAPEVIALKTGGAVAAVDGTGQVEWTSTANVGALYPQPVVGDLDGDGAIEVVFDTLVVEGATGVKIVKLSAPDVRWRQPIIADLDADGSAEILLGDCLYDTDGTVLDCTLDAYSAAFGAVADLDGDPEGEYLVVSGSEMYQRDSDGSPIRTVVMPGTAPGPPCVADLDGDGAAEIAVPSQTLVTAFEIDGTQLWSAAMSDVSGFAGCSAFDVDGDGDYEVLFGDEAAFRIYDGRTGAVLYEDFTHTSATIWEYPTVADLDGDGSAEIVVANAEFDHVGLTGITVYGHAAGAWPPSGTTWAVHDFAVTNVAPDGTVPSPSPLYWQDHNLFRARPAYETAAPDLFVTITDVCATSCTLGPVRVSWQVANEGRAPAAAGALVALYALDAAGTETLLDSFVLPEVPDGEALAGEVFEIDPAELGVGGLLVRVDADDVIVECDEEDGEDSWTDPICP